MIFRVLVVLFTLGIGMGTYYYFGDVPVPMRYIPSSQEEGLVHPGAEKADVKRFYRFLTDNPEAFDQHHKDGDKINASLSIDGVEYLISYNPSSVYSKIVVVDGSYKFSFIDYSVDGTVDWFSVAEYSYWKFRYLAYKQPKNDEEFNSQMNTANYNYEKYVSKLVTHFHLKDTELR